MGLSTKNHRGLVGQHISVHDQEGELCSTTACHDGCGILGPKIAAVSCLTFHPHRIFNSSRETSHMSNAQLQSSVCVWPLVVILLSLVYYNLYGRHFDKSDR
ncbi:hypothetical protein OUZ56_001413 [Daphnia magna]|uniref:Uncharacterized protein n=1 Tax=Daphnia magna TaxID=35525 RepID=A0ABR0A357_9CRUS|nr:hypothetical protein OUZ56_001413 [Daphnia magna]